MIFFSCNAIKSISMKNQKCRKRSQIININANKPSFYPYSILVNKYSGSCNNVNDPFAKSCALDVVKNINVKVFNLMSRIKETRHISWHETCKCKFKLDASGCNNKQRWNKDKCRCEYKELFEKRKCDKGVIWNSIFEIVMW